MLSMATKAAALHQEEGTCITLAVDGKGPFFLQIGGEGGKSRKKDEWLEWLTSIYTEALIHDLLISLDRAVYFLLSGQSYLYYSILLPKNIIYFTCSSAKCNHGLFANKSELL